MPGDQALPALIGCALRSNHWAAVIHVRQTRAGGCQNPPEWTTAASPSRTDSTFSQSVSQSGTRLKGNGLNVWTKLNLDLPRLSGHCRAEGGLFSPTQTLFFGGNVDVKDLQSFGEVKRRWPPRGRCSRCCCVSCCRALWNCARRRRSKVSARTCPPPLTSNTRTCRDVSPAPRPPVCVYCLQKQVTKLQSMRFHK